jgi:hypothetical protein
MPVLHAGTGRCGVARQVAKDDRYAAAKRCRVIQVLSRLWTPWWPPTVFQMAHTQQTAVLWQWRFYDASRRRWITLWWHMTPEEAEAWGDARGVKLERLDPPEEYAMKPSTVDR